VGQPIERGSITITPALEQNAHFHTIERLRRLFTGCSEFSIPTPWENDTLPGQERSEFKDQPTTLRWPVRASQKIGHLPDEISEVIVIRHDLFQSL
jgi:hypothetical protein